uniref:CRAL-TRIO domain-containing protein n=1 Tax=Chloropicon laureae TaxID=464258 RepID=A0A7S2Z5R2_9CHLO|mmetsp:Transcript_6058/g.15619  ORF Transcript_6058/g.15619 Transcript_6058/m.15619 type:complete len:235 (+) Transcript_6058:22-726(+)|eukprot:CAMPEP_0197497342 /NCGR_PEP_ID=MMETSP1311-20131121/50602_1 /TAXON_ID=464262 /ORGANISM="Genus nov. species nov., Strain RCC856" /LENGTH=234 /DNA_ID=CAMNT_0043042999 /DNA_START=22 /DNA_END=726 /DNA_ORIENTATION=-
MAWFDLGRTVAGWQDYAVALSERGKQIVLGSSIEDEAKDQAYAADLEQGRGEDFRDLDELGFSKLERVNEGQWLWLIFGRRLPMQVLDKERVWRFMQVQMDEVDGHASVVYVHHGATYHDNCPGLAWMGAKLKGAPASVLEKVRRVLVLHPCAHLWSATQLLGTSLLHSLWPKTVFVMRIESLWEHLDRGVVSVALPSEVEEHDAYLEANPLSDFYIAGSSLATQQTGAEEGSA